MLDKFRRDLAVLFASPAGLILLLAQALLLGWGFRSSAGSYANLSGLMAAGDLPAWQLSPLADCFGPAFRQSYLFLLPLLPAAVTGLLRGRTGRAELNFTGELSRVAAGLGMKCAAALIYCAALLALSLPALWYWRMLGGWIYPAGAAYLYAGYFLYGALAVSVSLLCASLMHNRGAAALAAAALLALPHALDTVGCTACLPTIADMMACFENGTASPLAAGYFLVPSVLALACAGAALVRGRAMKARAAGAAAAVAAALVIAGVSSGARGFIAVRADISDRNMTDAAVSVIGNAETALLPYLPAPAYGVPAGEAGVTGGHLPAITDKDLRDLMVVYWVLFPLLIGFAAAAHAVGKSGMGDGTRRVVIMTGTWLVLVLACALLQDFYFKNGHWKIFPSVREILPQWMSRPGFLLFPEGYSAAAPDKEETPDPGQKTNFIYAGDDYRNLKRFFGRLADLKAERRDVVRVVHFGDSLIWGDCFARTMKRRLQSEFGDGGRGIVPAAATMATTLQDHVNATSPGWFVRHDIRHEFRPPGGFSPAPPVNLNVGFTGEGAFLLSPQATVRMEAPGGSAPWKRAQVFVRAPRNGTPVATDCSVSLRHGSGTASRAARLKPGETAALSFDIPAGRAIEIGFEGTAGPLLSVDAVNVETGHGVAYSAIVRMGIHMAWMNAIPEQSLAALREIRPDLVIFQFGVNEAASLGSFPEFTEDTLRAQVRGWLARVKRLLPDADVLIVGPPERLAARMGALVPMEETMTVRRVQREEAERAGMAFFDTYGLLGGPGQMLKMAGAGLAMDDYTHFTMRGGDMAAGGMYDALMNAFEKKNGRPTLDLRLAERTAIMFNSASYAYFLVVTVVVVLLMGRRAAARFAFLAAASYYFYATWNAWPAACLAATTLTDYSMAILIYRARKRGGRGTGYLAASLGFNLGVLFALKYFDFFSDLAGKAAHLAGLQVSVPILNLLLPVGISFYTFQSLSYTIDVWRGAMKPTGSLVKYAHYVSLFTQLLAGPIVKAREFLPAIKNGAGHFAVTHAHFSAAIFLILAGLLKKAGADWLGGSIVDRVYASPGMFTPLETLAAVYAYGLQIYGDFSGYSDIAVGSAMLLGYNLTENFRRPYASVSVSEFWQRWHISLGSWLREYLYISLGGNRKRVLLNIGITMLLCGLWHGAALPFVVWGAYHGLIMIVERIAGLNKGRETRPSLRRLRVFITLHAVLFGWIIFRSDSWETFTAVMRALFRAEAGAPNVGGLLAGMMVLFYAAHYTPLAWKERLRAAWAGLPAAAQGLAAACVTVFLYNIATAGVKPFIYFRF